MSATDPYLLRLDPSLLANIASHLSKKEAGSLARVHSRLRDAGEAVIWKVFNSSYDLESTQMQTSYEDIEVLCEMLLRYPPRSSFVRAVDLCTGQADCCELDEDVTFWRDGWERTRARWQRLFMCLPALPGCKSLISYASHDYIHHLWLTKLPNLVSLNLMDANEERTPEFISSTIPPNLPAQLESLELLMYADLHCDLLDRLLSSSAASLRDITIWIQDLLAPPGFEQNVKDVLIRHGQCIPNTTAMTLPHGCYPGDDVFPTLRELAYSHIRSSFEAVMSGRCEQRLVLNDQADIIPRRRHLTILKCPPPLALDRHDRRYRHSRIIPSALLAAFARAPSLTQIGIGHDRWMIRSFHNDTAADLQLVHLCTRPLDLKDTDGRQRDMTFYRGRPIPLAVLQLVYARAGHGYYARLEGIRGGVLPPSAWELLDEWVDSTDSARDIISCNFCK